MKCDELKPYLVGYERQYYVYDATSVEEAIAELKDKIQMHDFFWEGCGFAKRGFKNAIAVAQYVEDLEAELRATRRALWIARAMRARDIQRWWLQVTCSPRTEVACMRWNNIERKCRAKAEQYK